MDKEDLIMNVGRLLETNKEKYGFEGNDYLIFLDNLIRNLQNKIVIFDIDGTLCKFKYTTDDSKHLLPCLDKDLGIFLKDYNMYNNTKPLKSMQYIISNLNPENVYTLSTSTEPAKIQKNEWIRKYYPTIKKEHIIYSSCDTDKLNYLTEFYKKRDKEIVFIDDSYKTLLYIEENLSKITLIHTSTFVF